MPKPQPAGQQRDAGTDAVLQLNCTARRFVNTVLDSVIRQLHLAGVSDFPTSTLSYHFDPGHSQAKQSQEEVSRLRGLGTSNLSAEKILSPQAAAAAAAATSLASEEAAVRSEEGSSPSTECSDAQLPTCARAVAALASLDGLAEYLVDALEEGVARPTPERLSRLGWAPAAEALLGEGTSERRLPEQEQEQELLAESRLPTGPVELGGGSGAGFQVICEDRGLATLGGGGGGGAFGWLGGSSSVEGANGTGAFTRAVAENETLGGGAGGGMQLFFPADLGDTPWDASRWIAWSSGGGTGCGSCKAGDAACEASPFRVTCGAKMDDTGTVREDLGRQAAEHWRNGVLRQCYEAGRLSVIGGGGGGAGSALCCASLPRLKFGFGFRAEIRPPPKDSPERRDPFAKRDDCCPDLDQWNSSSTWQGALGSNLAADFPGRRLAGEESEPPVDPFARENTGAQDPRHVNDRPNLGQMMHQQDHRLGVDRSALLKRTAGSSCALPAWINDEKLSSEVSASRRGSSDGSGTDGSATKEPEVALKYIFKFNPLQGHLSDGAGQCGGWSDWCCVCHVAQWRIACLPETERSAVDWFLTEDCCESKLKKNSSSPGFVVDATPLRGSTVMWRPGVGWVELPRQLAFSDSYSWTADFGDEGWCPPVVTSDFWAPPPPTPSAPSGGSVGHRGGLQTQEGSQLQHLEEQLQWWKQGRNHNNSREVSRSEGSNLLSDSIPLPATSNPQSSSRRPRPVGQRHEQKEIRKYRDRLLELPAQVKSAEAARYSQVPAQPASPSLVGALLSDSSRIGSLGFGFAFFLLSAFFGLRTFDRRRQMRRQTAFAAALSSSDCGSYQPPSLLVADCTEVTHELVDF
ncbi:unnamed protein product [Polarella glacialis]|uniref:Uncharacterized protein n=2 Tax=Polarella glacialis TaxID=89957 RepID=A0A813F5Q7_POLGL|nr:unnamed protein product [Polarella glacialis]